MMIRNLAALAVLVLSTGAAAPVPIPPVPIPPVLIPPVPILRVVDVEPAVAPDGTLAFVSNRNGSFELYTARQDGSELVQLTPGGGGKDTPAWSPDGQRIAFVVETAGNSDIFTIDRRGGAARRLTTSALNDLHPHWSPDGRRLVFTRFTPGKTDADGRLAIFTMDADGGHETQLSHGANASYASWSPDGRHLAYWRAFGDNADIVIADADGANEVRLTSDPAFEGWPSWSPDSRSIAFAREDGDDRQILIVTLADRGIRALTSGPGRNGAPKWSEDGRAILFHRTLDGQTGLWRLAVEPGARPSGQSAN